MANPIISSLPAYVEQNRLPLIAKAAFAAKTAGILSLQTGVKGPTALNLISQDVTFGDGHTCSWTPSEGTVLSQRELTPAFVKINVPFCTNSLVGKWAQNQVRVAAGETNLPFEEEFVGGVLDAIKAKLETMLWKGDTGIGYTGLLDIAGADSSVNKIAVAAGTSAYAAILQAYNAFPQAAFKDDTVIFVGMDMYREYIQDLVEKNFYHYNPGAAPEEYMLPGTNVRVIGVHGLDGSKKIFMGNLSEIVYGTDLEGDDEVFKLWYSDDNDEFRLAVKFIAGAQYAFSDRILVATVA